MPKLINENIDNVKNEDEDILRRAVASKSTRMRRAVGETGVSSITRTKTGEYAICKEIVTALNNPKKIQISFTNESILIGEKLLNNNNSFNLKRRGQKGMIYSNLLIKEMEEISGLDFRDRTTIIFEKVRYIKNGKYPVAIIKII